jgi:hypothetical protein
MGVTYSEYVSVALVIQNATRMGLIAIHGLSGSAVFSTLSHKKCDCKNMLLNIKLVF